jgi:hypothetical protein
VWVGSKRDYLWFLWVLGYIVPFKKMGWWKKFLVLSRGGGEGGDNQEDVG